MASADTKQVDRYLASCREHEVHPNSAVVKQFSAVEGRKSETFNFAKNYLGPNGFIPVLDALSMNSQFNTLIVSGNGLRNQCVERLVDILSLHDPLTSLDVSDNVISDGGARHLLRLLHANPSVVELKAHNNPMDEHFFTSMRVGLQKNVQAQEEIARELEAAELAEMEEAQAKALASEVPPESRTGTEGTWTEDTTQGGIERERQLSGVGEESAPPASSKQDTESGDDGIRALLLSLFETADADKSGTLSAAEFRELIRGVDLGLSRKDISMLFAEADVDKNGDINYAEFIPMAMEVVRAIKERELMVAQMSTIEKATKEKAKDMLIKGVPKEEWKKMIWDSFAADDKNADGVLDRKEFLEGIKRANRESGLGLTKKEINALVHQVDVDKDGKITFDEFYPIVEEIVFDVAYRNWEKLSGGSSDSLESKISAMFKPADPEETGRALPKDLKAILEESDLGLSRMHIYCIFSQVQQDARGRVVVSAVTRSTAYVIKNYYIDSNDRYSSASISREDFNKKVATAFEEAASGNCEDGELPKLSASHFRDVLEKALGKSVSDSEYQAFLVSADSNNDGEITLDECRKFSSILYDGMVLGASSDLEAKLKDLVADRVPGINAPPETDNDPEMAGVEEPVQSEELPLESGESGNNE